MWPPTAQNELESLLLARIRVHVSSESNATEANEECDQPVPSELPKRLVDGHQPVSDRYSLWTKKSAKRRYYKARRLNRKGAREARNDVNPYLSHHTEQRSRHTPFLWESALDDAQRSTREH